MEFKNREEKVKAFKRLFSDTQDGVDILKYLKRRYYNRMSYVRKDKDETAFREGERSVIYTILKLVNMELK